jgi:hypothetical protein
MAKVNNLNIKNKHMKIYQPLQKLSLKNTILATAVMILLTSAIPSGTVAVNFSGEWKLNEQKSELGEFGERFAPKKLKVDAKTDSMSCERTLTSQSGEEVKSIIKLTFDGKETEGIAFGNSKRKSTAKWSDDGQSLLVNSTIFFDQNGQTTEIKVNEVWKLTDNGNSLAIESNSSSSFGDNSMKLVYDKVK